MSFPDHPGADTQKLIEHFSAQQSRANCLHGVLYFSVTEADRQAFPELRSIYAVAIGELPSTRGKGQCWLIATEAAYDDEILAALSCAGFSNVDPTAAQ